MNASVNASPHFLRFSSSSVMECSMLHQVSSSFNHPKNYKGYVPSTFAMICLLIAFGSWFSISLDEEEEKLKYIVCIATAGTAVLLGWPFCIVCIIPLALDCIFSFGFFKSLKTAIIVTVSLLVRFQFESVY